MRTCPHCHNEWDPAKHAACPRCAAASDEATLDAGPTHSDPDDATPEFDSGFFNEGDAGATISLDAGDQADFDADQPTLAGDPPAREGEAARLDGGAAPPPIDEATPDLADSAPGSGTVGSGAVGSSRSDPNAATIDRESDPFAFTESPGASRAPRPTERDIPGASHTTPRGMPTGRTSAPLRPGESISIASERVRLKSHQLGATPLPEGGAPAPDTLDYEHADGPWEGGMGQVWKSRQSTLDRFVAIKQVRAENPTERDRSKLVSEAVITGSLEHPNIIPVHDLGVDSNGLPFYSMKFVGGLDWDDARKERAMSEAENLAVLVQVAQAIAFAHSRGVIHMDLKPNNIRLGDFGEVLVMDWGLAARLDRGGIEPGGTPGYMAPELALPYYRRFLEFTPEGRESLSGSEQDRAIAKSKDDTRPGPYSDVYLLGALLFWIVTEKPPHRGKSRFKLLQAAARNAITPTTRRSELLDIAYKAMATDPAKRYATAGDFIQAVRDYQEHAQSVEISRRASRELKAAEKLRHSGDAEAKGLYEGYSRARHGFENALALWPDNAKARRRLERTLRFYAEAAYSGGDYDLALSMLDAESDADRELAAEVTLAQKRRQSRDAWYRTLQYATAASLLAALVFIGISGYFERLAHQQQVLAKQARVEAEEQTRLADAAKADARQAEESAAVALAGAAEARREADQATAEAAEANLAAKTATEQARLAESEADAARDAAREQRYLAAVASVRSTLAEDGAYAAAKVLDRLGEDLTDTQRDTREWLRLARLADWRSEATELRAADGKAAYVAASADGRWLAIAAFDGESTRVTMASTEADGPAERAFVIDLDPEQIALSHDGRFLAARSDSLGVWDTQSGERLAGGPASATTIAMHPSRDELVAGGADTSVSVWRLDASGTLSRLRSDDRWHRAPLAAVGYSPDGAFRYSADGEGVIRVWRSDQDGDARPWSYRHGDAAAAAVGVTCVAMTSRDEGGRLAYGCGDGAAYELAGGWSDSPAPSDAWIGARAARLPDAHLGPVDSIAYADGAALLVTSGADASLVRRAPGGRSGVAEPKRLRQYHDQPVVATAVGSADFAYSADASGRVVRWKIDTPPDDRVFAAADADTAAPITKIEFDPRDGEIGAADAAGFVRLWRDTAPSSPPERLFVGHADNRGFRAWQSSAPEPVLVTVAEDGAACVWSGDNGELLGRHELEGRDVVDVTESGVLVAAAPGRDAISISLANGRVTPLWSAGARVSAVAALTPDAGLIAVGLRDGQFYLWSREGGRLELIPSAVRPHWRPIRSIAIGAEPSLLLVGDSGGVVTQWRVGPTGGELLSEWLLEKPYPVERVGVTADGRLFALQRWAGATALHRWREGDRPAAESPLPGLTDVAVVDGRLVALGRDGRITPIDALPDDAARLSVGEAKLAGRARPMGLTAAPGGGLVVYGEGVAVWEQPRGQRTVALSRPPALSVSMPTDDQSVLTIDSRGRAHIWPSADAAPRAIDFAAPGPIVATARAPHRGDAWLLAIADGEDRVTLYETTADADEPTPVGRPLNGRFEGIAAGPNHALVALRADDSRRLVLLEREPDAFGEDVPIHGDGRPVALALAAAGDRIAVVDEEGICRVAQRVDGRWRVTPLDRPGVSAVAFTPDAGRLLVGLESGQVLALRLDEGDDGALTARQLLTLQGHPTRVTVLGYADDDQTLLSGDAQGRVVAREF